MVRRMSRIAGPDDIERLQRDLDWLVDWNRGWQMFLTFKNAYREGSGEW